MRAATRLARARPEWALRLEHLRSSLDLSQHGLAGKLGVSAMAVSRWERGVNEPPARCYIELGKLVGPPQCWYFWERAGLTRKDVLRALGQ